jgi:hypothetical protein
LGWWSMRGRRDMLRLRFWGKIVLMGEERTTKRIYRVSRKRHMEGVGEKGRIVDNWCRYTHKIMEELGLKKEWESEKIGKFEDWKVRVREAIERREMKDWMEGMAKKKGMRVYRRYKRVLGKEGYLGSNRYDFEERGRQILTKFRLGCAGLNKEMNKRKSHGGRMDNGFCQLCWRAGEDEEHVVLDCPAYDKERDELFKAVDKNIYFGNFAKFYVAEAMNVSLRKPFADKSRAERLGLLFGQWEDHGDNDDWDSWIPVMQYLLKIMAKRKRLLREEGWDSERKRERERERERQRERGRARERERAGA